VFCVASDCQVSMLCTQLPVAIAKTAIEFPYNLAHGDNTTNMTCHPFDQEVYITVGQMWFLLQSR